MGAEDSNWSCYFGLISYGNDVLSMLKFIETVLFASSGP
jgi:hypothetical protein